MNTRNLFRRQRARWLLWLARQCYFAFLRANGWRRVLLPSPLRGHGLVLKWQKAVGSVRYCVTTEEALQTESRLHQRWQQEALAR
jgi:hypothetical protein